MTDEAQSETPEYLIETNPSALEAEVEVFARLLHLLVVRPVRRRPDGSALDREGVG